MLVFAVDINSKYQRLTIDGLSMVAGLLRGWCDDCTGILCVIVSCETSDVQ